MSDDTKAAPRLMANSAIAWGLPYHQKPHAENEHCADLKCDLATEAHYEEFAAALRAVESVRAFPKTSPKQIVAETRHEAVAYAFGYRDGVEAVQALLEGER